MPDLPKEYLEKKEKEKKTDTSGSWEVLPGVCVSNVMPGNGEDQRVKLGAIEESDGGINGDIMERKRTNPGTNNWIFHVLVRKREKSCWCQTLESNHGFKPGTSL